MKRMSYRYTSTLAFLAAILTVSAPAGASETDIAPAPLGTTPSASVLPNLMFTLDDSGSMGFTWMPDYLRGARTCKGYLFDASQSSRVLTTCLLDPQTGGWSDSSADTVPSQKDGVRNDPSEEWPAGPPAYAVQANTIYYNPQITYTPGVDYAGNDLPSMNAAATANWTKVPINPYTSTATIDLTTEWPDPVFCKNSNDDPTSSSNCRRNGYKDGLNFISGGPASYVSGSFRYSSWKDKTDGTYGWPDNTNSGDYRWLRIRFGIPYYFTILPREYCKDANLTDCALKTAPSGQYIFPAEVRYCQDQSMADDDSQQSGNKNGSPRCQLKRDDAHRWIRYGDFYRAELRSGTTFLARPNRTDCAFAPNCSYAEEMTNFANWFAYYHTRMQAMKTSAGRAFSVLDDRYRLGFLTINANSTNEYLKIEKFTPTHKQDWYAKFYQQSPSGSTPLREALSRVGRHYGGKTDGINSFMPDDPVQYSCQRNYTILTTDGYWNNNDGQDLNGNAIGDQDNVDAGFSLRAAGAYDGNLGGTAGSSAGSSDTLADVAMYYYKTDLRPSMEDNVPKTSKDQAAHQHLVTFTLGLGIDGFMEYDPNYETAETGDFAKIKKGDPSGCAWTSGACNWPQAQQNTGSAIDDLWHAAVNGRGRYFSAKDPASLQKGLTDALASIQVVVGAAAASATSTPNITPTDNYIFSSTYRTGKWDGEVVAERIDTVTGEIIPGLAWSAGGQLNARVSTVTDTRSIYYHKPGGNNRENFLYSKLDATQKAFFDNKGSAMPQYSTLLLVDQPRADSGDNLVNWLRGQSGNSDVFRARENVLGDTVNSKPAFVGAPRLQYADPETPDYATFKSTNAARQGVLYIASNDGMLHAFNADTGQEMWAWVPRMIFPDLYKLAYNNYDTQHRYFVDGSPQVMDVYFRSQSKWKTVLVGGLKGGGRGFYAIDVTNPTDPKGLWEVCADPTGTLGCDSKDDNIGYSFGDPIITKWAKDPTKWVAIVSSGYNNVSPGDGKGWVFVIDIETGAILDKKDNGVGESATPSPSGLAHLTGFANNFAVDNTALFVYGGDLEGNVWRLDMTTMTYQRLGQTFDGSSPAKPQSITTKVDVTEFAAGFRVIYLATGRLLGTSDLQDPATLSPPEDRAYQQTVYAFKDTGADLGHLQLPAAKLVEQTIALTADQNVRTISNNPVDWSTNNGWFVDLNPSNASPGERVTIDPQLVRGVFLVATNEPKNEPCSAGGVSWTYQFDYQSGSYLASASQQTVGTKLSQALVAGVVVYRLPSGQLKYSAIDVTGKKVVGGVNPGGGGSVGKRVSWRELIL